MSRLAQLTHSMIHDCVDAMIAKTLAGTIVSWNSAAERLFGYAEQDVLGHSIHSIVPPELVGEESAILDRLAQGQRVQDLHTHRLNKSGQRIAVTMTISPLRDRDGQVIGASGLTKMDFNTVAPVWQAAISFTAIRIGIAKNTPATPQNQPANQIAKNRMIGLRLRRKPISSG